MRALVVNPGSTSLKLSIVDDGVPVDGAVVADWDGGPELPAIAELVFRNGRVDAVGLRVVHGGDRTGPTPLDENEIAALSRFEPTVPVHQPRALGLARALLRAMPGVPLFGCYDTTFHTRLPDHAATYPIPAAWRHRFDIRRYGFHGLSCANALRRTADLLGRAADSLSLICCHLGGGVSVTAIQDGHSVDTSMGFTPLDGAPMTTRPGSLDPGLVLHLLRELPLAEVESGLNHRSGLAGLSGTSGDLREVLARRAGGFAEAERAVQVYLHRLCREIAAARVSLRCLDALVLTGGVAEHQPGLCAELVGGLAFLGLATDPAALRGSGDRVVSPDWATSRVLVVRAAEELEIARELGTVLTAVH
ncbi:acetate kinase [Kutzneria viridogrisea]|uniref:Acetate kinase n=2 Tax=Kutzneria TaxID=43356 RepID=W5W8R3_9PSEU|nr:acetate kinase [Kutzneria albida]AHH96931.1 acetate kinase [Kutzneria albida DSM 43870]MBA8927846.1 acetate kinase [Kutzneria viridogrisea]